MARSQGAANAASLDAVAVVVKVLTALQPILISVISVAVKASSEAMLEELKKLHAGTPVAPPSQDKQVCMKTKFNVDHLEQYSRGENLREPKLAKLIRDISILLDNLLRDLFIIYDT